MKFRTWSIASGVLALMLSAAIGRADDSVDDLLPADTEQFIVLHVKALVDSEAYKKHITPAAEKSILEALPIEFLTKAAIDPFKDIDRVVVAAPVIASVDKISGLIVFCGRFDRKKIETAVEELAKGDKDKDSAAVVREGGHVYFKFATGQSKPMYLAVIDTNRLILAFSPDSVKEAIDRVKDKKLPVVKDKEILKALAGVDSKVPLFVRFDKSQLKILPGVDDPATLKLIDKVNYGTADVKVTGEVKLTVTLEMADADSAKELKPKVAQLAEQLQFVIGILALEVPTAKPLVDAAKTLEVATKGRTITLKMTVSAENLQALVKLFKT